MKTVILVLSSILLFTNSFCQNTSRKDALELFKRILIVGLEEPNERAIKKMKSNEANTYKNQIEGNNTTLKNAVEKYWRFNKDIKYMPLSEAVELLKNNKDKYALLKYNKYKDYEHYKNGNGWSRNSSTGAMTYNQGIRYSDVANEIMCLNIDMPSAICTVNLPNLYVSEADAVYGIMQLQYIFRRLYDSEKDKAGDIIKECHGDILKKKTLLINKDDLDTKLKEKEIAQVYPYKFKIVSNEEYDKAIVGLDTTFVIIQIVSAQAGKGNVNIHFLSEPSSGCIVGYVAPKMAFGIKGTSLITYNQKIKEKQLKDYTEIANCK